ncbi:MAG: GtrA family protein [Candidatus Riflebacteria bacterium]|nr:GtrA family protein [Candidatus Riflebacteria bacterium]
MDKEKLKIITFEFLRYIVVGGIAFVVDFGSLYLFKEFVFYKFAYPNNVYLATAVGFILGLIVNYVLSLKMVFTQAKDQGKGRDTKSFIIFAIIGIIGLGLTQLGMYLGCDLLKPQLDNCLTYIGDLIKFDLVKYGYLLVKCIVTAIVLLWNYAGRKIIIFR